MASTKKDESLRHWRELPDRQDPLPHFRPIPYKSTGSSFGACGVRIDGSPAFIDAVLSNLKTLIAGENHCTRLELSRKTVEPMPGKSLDKAVQGAEVCYVRCHIRGGEGARASVFFDRHLAEPTRQFAAAQGITVDDCD